MQPQKRPFVAVGSKHNRPRRVVVSRAHAIDRSVRLRTLVMLGVMGVACMYAYDAGAFDNFIEWVANLEIPAAPKLAAKLSELLYGY